MAAVFGSGELAVGARRALRARARSDAALVRAAQSGSADAFDELFARHWPRAYRAACLVCGDSDAAEDVAQEAFLAAIRALDRFDRRRPFGPWLHRIVVNRAIDHTRTRALRREVAGDRAPEAVAPEVAAPDEELVEALAALGVEQRAVVVLRHLLGYTPGEIARLLDLPRGTVNSRLRRGLDALAADLGAEKGAVTAERPCGSSRPPARWRPRTAPVRCRPRRSAPANRGGVRRGCG